MTASKMLTTTAKSARNPTGAPSAGGLDSCAPRIYPEYATKNNARDDKINCPRRKSREPTRIAAGQATPISSQLPPF
ncbi:MAG: hypothetical protein GX574_01665 [Lentisphaerae bacterium]|nr:hypothetical protein [Lentisphaerota bacterium]